MKIPLSWLKESLNIQQSPDQISKILTLAGLEVDAVDEVEGDVVFEISLTPNLGHCSSVIGVARELSAATNTPYHLPKINFSESSTLPSDFISVTVEAKQECPRYACRVVRDVRIGPSPNWLKNRVELIGFRSVNNVVDVTNYVMHELGHPLHAFDADQLHGNHLIIRKAQPGETFVTLDGKKRILDNDLLICDQKGAVALGGIMGGQNSEVTENTKHLVLEAAVFSPGAVRKTSKRLGLITDGSKRFERGCDPNILRFALDRAVMLIQQVAGGKVCAGILDVAAQPFTPRQVTCRLSRINQLLGTRLSVSEVESLLARLELTSRWDDKDQFTVTVPTYRNDIHEEVDLIEEVARTYGYQHITRPTSLYQSSTIPHAPIFMFEREVRARLMGEGLQEFLTCDLIGPSLLEVIHGANAVVDPSSVKVLNPTSVEQSVLRTSLLPGLLQVVKYNWDHQNHDVAGFEIGRIHLKQNGQYLEQSVAAIILSGKSRPHHWDRKPNEEDFFDLKGILENLLSELNIQVTFKAGHLPMLHPGRQAAIYAGEIEVGSFGEIHPAVRRRLDVPQPILFAELNLHDLLQVRPGQDAQMKPLPIYPGSERDWTLTIPEALPAEELLKAIQNVSSPFLEHASLHDIYRSDKLGKGLKNVTLRFFYRDSSKTISQETVDMEHARIVESVSKSVLSNAMTSNI